MKMPYPSYEVHSVSPGQCRAAVARSAYYKWLSAGQPQGRDLEFWVSAEQEVTRNRLALVPSADSGLMPLWADLQQAKEAHCVRTGQ
jgi:hypothetical protein